MNYCLFGPFLLAVVLLSVYVWIFNKIFLEPEWAIDSEAMVKKILRINIFRKLKLDINPFLSPKHYKYGGRFLLLVGYNIIIAY